MAGRSVLRRSAAVVGAWLQSGLAQAGPSRADLVLENGTVYTLDARKPKAQAIAISGHTIAAVGTNDDVRRWVGPGTRVIDLQGRTVVPGFTEGHGHLFSLGASRRNVDLVGTASYRDVVDRVAAAVGTREAGEWVIGRGWHESKWTGASAPAVRGFPTHAGLSAVSPANPVFLERADGHAALVNARALELMGITRDTKAPEGGEIIKDVAGTPTGVVVDNAMDLVRLPPPGPAEQRKAFELAVRESLEKGITAFHDAGATLDEIALYKEYAAQGRLGLRLYVMVAGLDALRRLGQPQVGLGNGFLTLRSVKLVADGALGSRGAALIEPYADDTGHSGFFTTPPETILEAARYGLAHGFQVNVHAIGDRANRMVLDVFEKAFREHPQAKDPRFRIEHAQILDEHDIPRFGRLGVIASMQGIHATSDRPWAADRLGMARVSEGAYVWRKLLESGARILNGTDAPVEDVSPIRCFYASVTRQDASGRPPGGFDPEQRMTREQVLRSYTIEAAYGAFEEKERGSVEVGKLADLTVLSKDIMTVPDAEILKAEVVYTIVDGRVRYEKDGGPRPEDRPVVDAEP